MESPPEPASTGGAAPDRDNARVLPPVDVADGHRLVQAAAFALLFEEGRSAPVAAIAARADVAVDEVADRLADLVKAGRVRLDSRGAVVGIAGLSIEETRHRIEISGTTRWTWCALDAIGILAALGRPATVISRVPGSDEELTLDFADGRPGATDAVVFIADGYGCGPVVDNWCPTVNLFPDPDAAWAWAEAQRSTGRPVPVAELAPRAAEMWAPVITLAAVTGV